MFRTMTPDIDLPASPGLALLSDVAGGGHPVFVIHGLGGSHHDWDGAVESLAQQHSIQRIGNFFASMPRNAPGRGCLGSMNGAWGHERPCPRPRVHRARRLMENTTALCCAHARSKQPRTASAVLADSRDVG